MTYTNAQQEVAIHLFQTLYVFSILEFQIAIIRSIILTEVHLNVLYTTSRTELSVIYTHF